MPLLDSAELYAKAREVLRDLPGQFLLRHYEATLEDYEQIADEDLKCEYVDGELIVHSPASFRHEEVVAFVLTLLRTYVSEKRLGRVVGSNAVMMLGEGRFSPDVSVLLHAHEARIQGGRVAGPLDLVVEVLSASTRRYDRGQKLDTYREGRIPEVWLIDPDERRFETHVLRDGQYERQELTTGRWSSAVLPGFSIDVSWLWSEPLPPVGDCQC